MPDRARVVGWSFALTGSALLVLAGWLLVRFVTTSRPPPFVSGQPTVGVHEPGAPKPSNLLRLAGSGSNLPLTRALAEAFVAKRPWLQVRVHESIGSSGGVKATLDRAIDIGLISRELHPEEAADGLAAYPYARVAVVIAANPSVPMRSVTREELLDLYAGRREYWSDGSPVVLLKREPGDSSHLAVYDVIPEFAAVDAEAWESDRGRKLLHDRAMQEALVSTPGGVGLFDQGLATIQDLPIAVLEFEGLRPNEDAVRSGRYPLFKDLSFVVPVDDADHWAIEFMSFVYSSEGRELIRKSGYVPLDPPEHSSFSHLRELGPTPNLPEPEPEPSDTGETADAETETSG